MVAGEELLEAARLTGLVKAQSKEKEQMALWVVMTREGGRTVMAAPWGYVMMAGVGSARMPMVGLLVPTEELKVPLWAEMAVLSTEIEELVGSSPLREGAEEDQRLATVRRRRELPGQTPVVVAAPR